MNLKFALHFIEATGPSFLYIMLLNKDAAHKRAVAGRNGNQKLPSHS